MKECVKSVLVSGPWCDYVMHMPVEVVEDEEQEVGVELEGTGELLLYLPHTVHELNKHR